MRYLNWKSSNGRETVDELDPATFPSRKAYREEAGRLLREYVQAFASGAHYWSSRPCANWSR